MIFMLSNVVLLAASMAFISTCYKLEPALDSNLKFNESVDNKLYHENSSNFSMYKLESHEILKNILAKKNNIFFDYEKYIFEVAEKNKGLTDIIYIYLSDFSALEEQRIRNYIMEDETTLTQERTLVIEIVEDLLELKNDSYNKDLVKNLIISLINENIDNEYSKSTKQMILAQQCTLISLLAKNDLNAALSTIKKIKNPKHYKLLENAVIHLLINSGKTNEEAIKLVNQTT
jgi:hypothetical protein